MKNITQTFLLLTFGMGSIAALAIQTSTQPDITQNRETAPPVAEHRVSPDYTVEARAAHIEGVIRVRAHIGKDGSPSHVVAIPSLGYGLEAKAEECIRKWHFKPARFGFENVEQDIIFPVQFSLAQKTVAASTGLKNAAPFSLEEAQKGALLREHTFSAPDYQIKKLISQDCAGLTLYISAGTIVCTSESIGDIKPKKDDRKKLVLGFHFEEQGHTTKVIGSYRACQSQGTECLKTSESGAEYLERIFARVQAALDSSARTGVTLQNH